MHEIGEGYVERVGDQQQVIEQRRVGALLHAVDRFSVQAGRGGEFLLGDLAVSSGRADAVPDSTAASEYPVGQGIRGHSLTLGSRMINVSTIVGTSETDLLLSEVPPQTAAHVRPRSGALVFACPPECAVRRHDSVKASRPARIRVRGGLRWTAEGPHRHTRWGPSLLWAGPPRPKTPQISGRRVSGACGGDTPAPSVSALYVPTAWSPPPIRVTE